MIQIDKTRKLCAVAGLACLSVLAQAALNEL